MRNLFKLPVVLLTLGLWMLCTTVVSAQTMLTPECRLGTLTAEGIRRSGNTTLLLEHELALENRIDPLLIRFPFLFAGSTYAGITAKVTGLSDPLAFAGTMPESGIRMPVSGDCIAVDGLITAGLVPNALLADSDIYLLPVPTTPFVLTLIHDDPDAVFRLLVVDANTGAFISNCSLFLDGCSVQAPRTTDSVSVIISAVGPGDYTLLAFNGRKSLR